MQVKRVGVLSVGKVGGALYALMGLLLGAIASLVSLLGAASSGTSEGLAGGLFFGIGSIIFLPLVYGLIGAIFAMISALLYNAVAWLIGGIEVDLEQR